MYIFKICNLFESLSGLENRFLFKKLFVEIKNWEINLVYIRYLLKNEPSGIIKPNNMNIQYLVV
jgi:hypothetical protein